MAIRFDCAQIALKTDSIQEKRENINTFACSLQQAESISQETFEQIVLCCISLSEDALPIVHIDLIRILELLFVKFEKVCNANSLHSIFSEVLQNYKTFEEINTASQDAPLSSDQIHQQYSASAFVTAEALRCISVLSRKFSFPLSVLEANIGFVKARLKEVIAQQEIERQFVNENVNLLYNESILDKRPSTIDTTLMIACIHFVGAISSANLTAIDSASIHEMIIDVLSILKCAISSVLVLTSFSVISKIIVDIRLSPQFHSMPKDFLHLCVSSLLAILPLDDNEQISIENEYNDDNGRLKVFPGSANSVYFTARSWFLRFLELFEPNELRNEKEIISFVNRFKGRDPDAGTLQKFPQLNSLKKLHREWKLQQMNEQQAQMALQQNFMTNQGMVLNEQLQPNGLLPMPSHGGVNFGEFLKGIILPSAQQLHATPIVPFKDELNEAIPDVFNVPLLQITSLVIHGLAKAPALPDVVTANEIRQLDRFNQIIGLPPRFTNLQIENAYADSEQSFDVTPGSNLIQILPKPLVSDTSKKSVQRSELTITKDIEKNAKSHILKAILRILENDSSSTFEISVFQQKLVSSLISLFTFTINDNTYLDDIVDFIAQEFDLRYSIGLRFLYKIFVCELEKNIENKVYTYFLTELLRKSLASLPWNKTSFENFTRNLPIIPDALIELINNWIQNDSKESNTKSTFSETKEFREILFSILKVIIQTRKKEIAFKAIEKLIYYACNCPRPSIKARSVLCELLIENAWRDYIVLRAKEEIINIEKEANINFLPVKLYYSFCEINTDLFQTIFLIFSSASKHLKKVMINNLGSLVLKMIENETNYSKLLLAIENAQSDSCSLIAKVLQIITDENPPRRDLIDSTLTFCSKNTGGSEEVLIEVATAMKKDELTKYLPSFIDNLAMNAVALFLQKFALHYQKRDPTIDYSEYFDLSSFLVALISISDINEQKHKETISLSLSDQNTFTDQVIAIAFQHISDLAKLPILSTFALAFVLSSHQQLIAYSSRTILPSFHKKGINSPHILWKHYAKCLYISKNVAFPIFALFSEKETSNILLLFRKWFHKNKKKVENAPFTPFEAFCNDLVNFSRRPQNRVPTTNLNVIQGFLNSERENQNEEKEENPKKKIKRNE